MTSPAPAPPASAKPPVRVWDVVVTSMLLVAVAGLIVRRRFAFWVPIAAAPLIVLLFFVGSGIAGAGVPPA